MSTIDWPHNMNTQRLLQDGVRGTCSRILFGAFDNVDVRQLDYRTSMALIAFKLSSNSKVGEDDRNNRSHLIVNLKTEHQNSITRTGAI